MILRRGRLGLLSCFLCLFVACAVGCGKQQAPLTIGVLPITDNLPFWIAEEKGYLNEEGVEVNFVTFPSAMERDSAFTAGQIDVGVGDLLAVAQMRQGGTEVKAIAVCQGVKPEEGRFAVLSAPGSGITEVEHLKNVPVACSLKTINEFVLDRLLVGAGFKPDEIRKVVIAKIPVRLEALLNGSIKAAVLPDPFAALAEANGAHLIVDDTTENISQTVVIARDDTVTGNLEALKRLMKAYDRAVADIQADPEAWGSLLKEKARVPDPVLPGGKHGLKVTFSRAVIPAREDVKTVVDWLKDKSILKENLDYGDLVEERVIGG
ncbi:MAG: myristoyl transferase [Ammonifex sp.]|nr:MAG: myristoyl transferase [Ammonifex sp.]